MSSLDNTYWTTILKKVHPFLERSLVNLIWIGEFFIDNLGLLLIRLDETVWRPIVRTGLYDSEYELAIKLVPLMNLDAQGRPENLKQTEWLNSFFIVSSKSFNTYLLILIFCVATFEISGVLESVHMTTQNPLWRGQPAQHRVYMQWTRMSLLLQVATMRTRCVITGLPGGQVRGTACEDEESRAVREHAVGSHRNRQHGVQAHFPARHMGVHDFLPFITYLCFWSTSVNFIQSTS